MRDADQVALEVAQIELGGAARVVLVDDAAVGRVHSPEAARVRRLRAALGVDVVLVGADRPTIAGSTVAIFGLERPRIADCHAWFVGAQHCPDWMRPTAGLAHGGGSDVSEQIDGTSGASRGARSLSWAHAELITTLVVLQTGDSIPELNLLSPAPADNAVRYRGA